MEEEEEEEEEDRICYLYVCLNNTVLNMPSGLAVFVIFLDFLLYLCLKNKK